MQKKIKISPQYILFISTFLLVLFGMVMIFSASNVIGFAKEGDSYFFLKRHLIGVVIGGICAFFLARYNYRNLKRLIYPALAVSFVLLGLVLVPQIGKVAGGSSRWLPLGIFNFQPSEFAKFVAILYAAKVLSERKRDVTNFKELLLPLSVVGAIFLLIVLQPHLGTAFLIVLSFLVLLFLAGARIRHLIGLGVAGTLGVSLFILLEEYRLRRLLAFLKPWADPFGKGFHIIQSLLAFGSGGITGVGFGMSKQKFFYLPAAHTDFILAIIGEELGLIGSFFVVLLFVLFAYAGIRIALGARDKFGRLLASGITFLIVAQAVLNMGAVTGIFPVTGVPLPFLSYGSSSIVFTLLAVGVLFNIEREGRRLKKLENAGAHSRRRDSRSSLPRAFAG